MLVLVTGGGGVLGSHLVRSLLHRKMKVRILDVKKGYLSGLENRNLEICLGGIEEHDVVNEAMKKVQIVYHFAYTFSNDPKKAREINIDGTTNLLKSAMAENVQHFLCATSVAVIGKPKYFPIDENHPSDPESFRDWPLYAIIKHEIEKNVLSYYQEEGLPATAFRFALAYSKSSIFGYWYSRQILNQALKGEMIEVPLNIGMDWNHADDIAQGFTKASLNENAYGEIFQLASDAYLTWSEFAGHIVKWTRSKSRIVEMPVDKWNTWREGSQDPSYGLLCSCAKAKRLLGYKPKYSKRKFLELLQEETMNIVKGKPS